MKPKKTLPLRYRLKVSSRILLALAGGYLLTAVANASLARMFAAGGMLRTEAVMASAILGFIIYCVAVMWVFACREGYRAWAGILLPTLLFGVAGWLVGAGELA